MLYTEYLNNRRQYQEAGRDLLLTKKHACLFFEPGKGKTYPVIDALKEIDKEKNGNTYVLIISSCDAIRKMWKPEIVPQNILPKNTYLVTDRTAIGDMSEILLKTHWDVIIVDECHIVKSNSSKIHKLVYKLCKHTEYAWGLTGTPRGNTDIDIWCQLQALHVGGQGKLSYSAWTRIFCDFDIGYGSYGRFETPVRIKEKWQHWWNSLLDEFCIFVDYDEDDDMPDLLIEKIEIPYTKTQDYINAINGIIEVGEYATTIQKMVAITKAHQVCNGYIYLPDKEIYRYNVNKKLEYLDKYVEKGKCVIVYKYNADYEDLLMKYGNEAATDVITFKRGNYKVLLLQCGECKSFNLQDYCNTIIFYTLDYSFIKYKQMIHRCWRLGQKKETKIIVLQHADTVEKQIWLAVQNKQKMHDLYMSIKQSV
jgi:SNF2 family DNA or RNA helicase